VVKTHVDLPVACFERPPTLRVFFHPPGQFFSRNGFGLLPLLEPFPRNGFGFHPPGDALHFRVQLRHLSAQILHELPTLLIGGRKSLERSNLLIKSLHYTCVKILKLRCVPK